MSAISSLNQNYDFYYQTKCDNLGSMETWQGGSLEAQEEIWARDGIEDQQQTGQEQDKKIQQQTENVMNMGSGS